MERDEKLSDGVFASLDSPEQENEKGLLETHLQAVEREVGLSPSVTYAEGVGFEVLFTTYPTEAELKRAAKVLVEKGYAVDAEQDTLTVAGWAADIEGE